MGNVVQKDFSSEWSGHYYFVPLICYTYLLALLFVRLANRNSKLFLSIAIGIQFLVIALRYMQMLNMDIPLVFICCI